VTLFLIAHPLTACRRFIAVRRQLAQLSAA
jgi:hypothetical protein